MQSCKHAGTLTLAAAPALAPAPSASPPIILQTLTSRLSLPTPSRQARIDSLGLRYLSLGLTSFSLKDTLVGLGLTAASTMDTSLFTLKDAKALYVPAYPNVLGALVMVLRTAGSAAG